MEHNVIKNIQGITARNFRAYGKVIEYPGIEKKGTKRNLWRIVHRAPGRKGWRVAYLVLRDKSIRRLECHPDSDETFEPMEGRAVMVVAKRTDPLELEAFRLDKPVILCKGVWHGLIAVDNSVHLKIFENVEVRCRYLPFKKRIGLDKNLIPAA